MKRNRIAPEQTTLSSAGEAGEQLNLERLRRALEAMALDELNLAPLDLQSSKWDELPESVAVLGVTQTDGLKTQIAFWEKSNVEALGDGFRQKYLALVSIDDLPTKFQDRVKDWLMRPCLVLVKTVRSSVWECLDQFLKEGQGQDNLETYIRALPLPEQTLVALWAKEAEVSKAFFEAVTSHVHLAKKPREAQKEQEASESGGAPQGTGTEQSLAASCEEEDEEDLLPALDASEDGREPVHTPSSAGMALGNCRHLVFSETHKRNVYLLCKESGVNKVHDYGNKHIPELIQKLGVKVKPYVKGFNNGEPIVDGKEEDYYPGMIAHVKAQAARLGRTLPGIVDVSAHKTGLSAVVNTGETSTFISGGADFAFLAKEASANPEVNKSHTAVTCDAKKTPTAKEMIPQLVCEHFGGTARSVVPHMTLGGDFATVMHIVMTRSYVENGSIKTSIDVYRDIEVSMALAIAFEFVFKVKRRELPDEYVQGSTFLRGTARAATTQEVEYFCP